jgi:hypothetical protein
MAKSDKGQGSGGSGTNRPRPDLTHQGQKGAEPGEKKIVKIEKR